MNGLTLGFGYSRHNHWNSAITTTGHLTRAVTGIIDTMLSAIRLPCGLQRRLDAATTALLSPPTGRRIDFSRPPGEEALLPAHSVSWRIFKNPIALFIGGVAAVILELAEPAVRTGVWEHSSFRKDPMGRLQRTGMAAMVTVYGARSIAEPMIAGVVRMHARVAGKTPDGVHYSANDARLLTWVQATAAFGFAQAYSRYVDPLKPAELDALYREGAPTSRLYGALGFPGSDAELQALLASMRGRLEPSPVVFQFLQIMRDSPTFPPPVRWMQRSVDAAAAGARRRGNGAGLDTRISRSYGMLWIAFRGEMDRKSGRGAVG
jgi:uncharacterized protein (DUF2236 family)